MTLEEKLEIIKKRRACKSVKERKEARTKLQTEINQKKKTHDWFSVFSVHGGSASSMAGSNNISHCKRCGVPFLWFKIKPLSCEEVIAEKAIKNKAKDEVESESKSKNE